MQEVIKSFDEDAKSSYTIPDTKLVADFYLPSIKTVIEVNGPSHYIKRIRQPENFIFVTSELNGRSLAKERRVKHLGFKLVTINFNAIVRD